MSGNTTRGWYFPPTVGGQETGFHDSGIATFEGERLDSLAREVIQNSLDAGCSFPVSVSFEIKQGYLPGSHEFLEILRQCLAWDDDEAHRNFFHQAIQAVSESQIDYLRIVDEGTTGLDDRSWDTLVQKTGARYKPGSMPGGGFGIGKHAPYALDALRTAFYWSAYQDGNGVIRERLQGKAILTSHQQHNGQVQQNVGFYGCISPNRDSCNPLQNQDVDSFFRHLDREKEPVVGTTIWIPGFRRTARWTHEIAASVVASYFHAIRSKQLAVYIEPETTGLPLEINHKSLSQFFRNSDLEKLGSQRFRHAKVYDDVLGNPLHRFELDDPDLGPCRLYVTVRDNLPRRVAVIRGSGMLISDQQTGLLRFPGCRDFAAVFVCDNEQGDAWLRQMENPQHNRFEPDRLPDASRAQGQQALKRITGWIRNRIKEVTGLQVTGHSQEISELAPFFPDRDTEILPGDRQESGEVPQTDSYVEYKPMVSRAVSRPEILVPEPNGDFAPDDEAEESAIRNGENESLKPPNSKSESQPEDGVQAATSDWRAANPAFPIENVRIAWKGSNLAVAFTPLMSGNIAFHLERVGDSRLPHNDAIIRLQDRDILIRTVKAGERVSELVAPVDFDISHIQTSARIRAYQQRLKEDTGAH